MRYPQARINVETHEWEEGDDPYDKPTCIGQWCCGCAEHPIGKPWGWNSSAWETHYSERHGRKVGDDDAAA